MLAINNSIIKLYVMNYMQSMYPDDFIFVYDDINDIDVYINKQQHLPMFKKTSQSLYRHIFIQRIDVNTDDYIYETFISRMDILNLIIHHCLRWDERVLVLYVVNDEIVNDKKHQPTGNDLVIWDTIDKCNKFLTLMGQKNNIIANDVLLNYDYITTDIHDSLIYALHNICECIDDYDDLNTAIRYINVKSDGVTLDTKYINANIDKICLKLVSIDELVAKRVDKQLVIKMLRNNDM